MSFEGTIENVTKIETDGCDKFSTTNMISRFCGRLVVDYLFWPICGWVLKEVLRIKLAPWLAHGRPSQMWKNSTMMTNSIKLMRLFFGSRNIVLNMKKTEIGIKLAWKTWASRKRKVGGGEEEKSSTFFHLLEADDDNNDQEDQDIDMGEFSCTSYDPLKQVSWFQFRHHISLFPSSGIWNSKVE